MKKNLFGVLISAALLLTAAWARAETVSFEERHWNKTLEQVRAVLLKEGQPLVSSLEPNTIAFTDRRFGRDCTVTLFFTGANKMLYMSRMRWSDPAWGEGIKRQLRGAFGEPEEEDVSNKRSLWWAGKMSIAFEQKDVLDLYYIFEEEAEAVEEDSA